MMETYKPTNSLEIKMQGLIDLYLRHYAVDKTIEIEAAHLTEDTLTAFVEGSLSERESQPTITHLIKCSFCRHVTTELVRLDLAFAEDEEILPNISGSQPTKISDVLNGFLSRFFSSSDSAVFAHQEEDKTDEDEAK